MRAAVAPATGRAWEIRDLPDPQPGPNQVVIRIRASGLCYTDVHQTKGELEALQFVARGKVKVMVETYALDEIQKAYTRVAEGKVRFRAVVTPT